MVEINGERLLGDLRALRTFGATGNGVVRRSLSAVDMDSRRWLVKRMREAGLEAGIDGMGTVLGRAPGVAKALLLGSHTDTQPSGGWLDGTLGVMYGLEVARALREAGVTSEVGIDVASWIDEEGSFSGLLGSRAFCGQLPDEILDTAKNDEGKSLREAIRLAGLEGVPRERLDGGRYVAYVEAHIEQGPYLEEEGNRIGVVTGIVGIRAFELELRGQQNHAGTTPMPRRRDAARALLDLGHAINEAFERERGARTVWTIGQLSVHPGATSIIPGRARMVFQMRDVEDSLLDHLQSVLYGLVEEANRRGPVEVSIKPFAKLLPAMMDPDVQAHLAAAAERHAGGAWAHMPSGAGHDAQVISAHVPAGMLFIPSVGGISHSFDEDTSEEDIVLGCRVLADAVAGMVRAGAARPQFR